MRPDKGFFGHYLEDYLPQDEHVLAKEGNQGSGTPSRSLVVSGTLDVHGMTLQEAIGSVKEFLKQARQENKLLVRIIHGKGNNSKGKAVLGPGIRSYLSGLAWVHIVEEKKRSHQIPGAVLVRIKAGV